MKKSWAPGHPIVKMAYVILCCGLKSFHFSLINRRLNTIS